MRTRPLGNTSLVVTELGLGTWGLSGDAYGPVSEADRSRVIEQSLAVGIRLFETADCYGSGAMERLLGERVPREGTVVVTKIGTRLDAEPVRKDFSPAYLKEAFERSRERLQRETVDCVLLHNPSSAALARDEVAGVMKELQASGAVRAWGASTGAPHAARAAIRAGAQVLQVPYNLFHRNELERIQTEVVHRKVGLLARSVLAHGLLCGTWPATREFGIGDHRRDRWTKDTLRRRLRQLVAMKPLVSDDVPSLRSVALRYVLANEAVSAAVLGPRTPFQLAQLVREAGKPPYLPSERLELLKERLSEAGVET